MIGTNFNYNTIKSNGNTKDSLNFVLVAEGFMLADMPTFTAKCIDIMNYILANDPWKSNAGNLNFYSINVISTQSGISHPFTCGAQCANVVPAMPKKSVTSYFGLSYDCSNIHRWILPSNPQTQLIQATIIASIPFVNTSNVGVNIVPIIICNDTNYGGSEFGSIAVTTLNTQSDEVILHELGHSVAALNDEFPGGTIANAWNTWTDNNPSDVEWKSLLTNGAGIIQIGSESLWKKALASCKMNTLGVPYCLVCSNQIVKSIGQLINIAGGTPVVPLVYPSTPPPPTGLTTAGIDSISLACQPVTGATGYTFKLNTGLTNVSSQPSTTFTGLTAKTAYSVTVTVTTPNGTSQPSNPFTFTTP